MKLSTTPFQTETSERCNIVKLHYYPETDSLYIELSEMASTDSQEVASGIVLDFDADGRLVGIDIDRADQVVDLSHLKALGLPLATLRAG